MRHLSPFSLHRFSAFLHLPTTSSASMSSRPPLRGGRTFRGRRSYSDRRLPSAESTAFTNDIRNSYNRNNSDNDSNNRDYTRVNYNYSNISYSNVAGGSGGGSNLRAQAPPYKYNGGRVNQPAARVERPKPADFRGWEYAKHQPSPNAERFVVLTYNILADYLANGHRKLYFHIPRRFMSWEWRKSNILFELKLWSPDVMCLQEVDKFQELEEDLRVRGYSGIWKMRTGDPVDGCAIFWRTTRFKLMYEECIEFKKHGMRDNVAQICVLESLVQKQSRDQLPSSLEVPNRVVICNIHVLYNPRRGEMKLGQVRMLLERAQTVSKTWDDASIVVCGDFNCTPKSPLYNFISEQKLDISQIERDKVSGQASAEIHPPPRQSSNPLRETPVGVAASSTVSPSNMIERKQNDSLQKYNASENIPGNISTAEQPLSEGSLLGVAQKHSNDPSPIDLCESGEQNNFSTLNRDGIDEKLARLSVNEVDEDSEENEDLGEDAEEFLSSLHDGGDAFPSTSGDIALETDTPDVDNFSYNPSLWTAMEIATATGDAESTILEHPLKLRSTYPEVMDSSGTRDSCGEPLVTSYNSCFMGTVDYIWRSEGLQTVKVLAPIPRNVMEPSRGFPTKKWGSDHIALASELAFVK